MSVSPVAKNRDIAEQCLGTVMVHVHHVACAREPSLVSFPDQLYEPGNETRTSLSRSRTLYSLGRDYSFHSKHMHARLC